MNPTSTKAIAALVPTGMLLVGSALQFSRRKGTAAIFQLIGAACLMVVIIAHVCEAVNWFPWMHWVSFIKTSCSRRMNDLPLLVFGAFR